MNKKTNVLLIFIILLIIFIILISITLIKIKTHNTTNTYNNSNNIIKNEVNINTNTNIVSNEIVGDEQEEPVTYTYTQKLEYETDRNKYFTIKEIFDKYIRLLGDKEKKHTLNILSPKYISEYNITESNVFELLKVPDLDNTMQYYKTNITEMLTTQVDDTIHIYIVKSKCRIVGADTIFEIKAMIEIDEEKNIYNIYPVQYIKDKGYEHLNQGDILGHVKQEINDRESNKFKYITKTDKEMANEYFEHYKELIKYYKDEAFYKLNTEYMQKRFENKENFEKHIEANETLKFMQINQYKVIPTQEYTDYICSDKYDNIYIFRQQGGIMRYNVFLDNYTVMSTKELEEYNKLDKFDKAKYNLNKFINMLNTKDYNAIYNSLDETFRINNFKTVEDLKQYIKNNVYDLNSLKIEEYDDETYKYYVFKCTIINMNNNEEKKDMTVIIDQSETTQFTMSFNFQ